LRARIAGLLLTLYQDGKSLYGDREGDETEVSAESDNMETTNLVMDGVRYHGINEDDIPPAFVKLPVMVVRSGEYFPTEMYAGMMGIGLSSRNSSLADLAEPAPQIGAQSQIQSGPVLDTMTPVASWWIMEKIGLDYKQRRFMSFA